jgi:hypothetical protein
MLEKAKGAKGKKVQMQGLQMQGPPKPDKEGSEPQLSKQQPSKQQPSKQQHAKATAAHQRKRATERSTFRVRHSVLSTMNKKADMKRKHFEDIFKTPSSTPHDSSASTPTDSSRPAHGGTKAQDDDGPLLSELSPQPNLPLHFGMELSLQSPTSDTPSFLACMHPHGTPRVLQHDAIRSGAGHYRGGQPPTTEKGPTDVAIFKVVDLNDQSSNRPVKYGSCIKLATPRAQSLTTTQPPSRYNEAAWLVVVPGRGTRGGHWSEGSVLGSRADDGIDVPVATLRTDVPARGAERAEVRASEASAKKMPVCASEASAKKMPVCASEASAKKMPVCLLWKRGHMSGCRGSQMRSLAQRRCPSVCCGSGVT